jgi:hypothetical protein
MYPYRFCGLGLGLLDGHTLLFTHHGFASLRLSAARFIAPAPPTLPRLILVPIFYHASDPVGFRPSFQIFPVEL